MAIVRTIIGAVLALSLAGCTTAPTITEIESDQCVAQDGLTLVSESDLTLNGRKVTECNYVKLSISSGHILDLIAPTYSVYDYKKYIYNGQIGTKESIARLTVKDAAAERETKRIAERKAKEQACLDSPECMAKRKQKQDKQRENNAICESFFIDLSSKTNFSHHRLVMAKPMITGTYICVSQGVVSTPYGNQFKQIELTGNPESGVYEYK